MRIVSLLPSATEIIMAMGLGEHLVGRSHECDHPVEAMLLPPCTAREIPTDESTPGIQLRATRPDHRALSIFLVDWGLLRGLSPTHILTQTLCAYCAVSEDQIRDVLASEFDEAPALISLKAQSLDGVVDEIRQLAASLGHPDKGEALAESMASRMRMLSEAIPDAPRPRVACLDWLEPVMLAGNWMPEIIRRAGGEAIGGGDGEHSAWIDWESVRSADPDVLCVMPCGYPLARIEREMQWLTEKPGWNDMRAVREKRVYLTDGSALFNRPGPRLVESQAVLLEILHPGLLPVSYEGVYWQRWEPTE